MIDMPRPERCYEHPIGYLFRKPKREIPLLDIGKIQREEPKRWQRMVVSMEANPRQTLFVAYMATQ